MKNSLFILFFVIYASHAIAQPPQYPNPPVVQYVSVDPITGEVHIQWLNSSSPHLSKYYIVQMADDFPGVGYTNPSADSVNYNPSLTSTSFFYDSVTLKAVWFNMIALDSSGNSSRGSYLNDLKHRTIFLTNTYDSCNSLIKLTWTKYVGWGDHLSKYIVMEIQNNSNTYIINDSIPVNDTTFSIYAGGNQLHTYYIIAVQDTGSVTSTCYRTNRFVKPNGLPVYINGNSSNFMNGKVVELEFTIDTSSRTTSYLLLRSSSPTGIFVPIRTITNVHGGEFITTDTISTTMYYSLEPMTLCNQAAAIPNLITAMVPSIIFSSNMINLTWPDYTDWYMGVKQYNIYRIIGDGLPEEIGSNTADQPTRYLDNISSLIGQHNQGNLCYYVVAVSNTDSMGVTFSSQSATSCTDLTTDIFIPNAFTPNGDGVNDLFLPYFAFEPIQFKMIIYNRSGGVIFESDNPQEGWNGTFKDGVKAPEGVYVYFITYTSSDGLKMNKKGSFSLIYP